MSMIECDTCTRFIDTDETPDAYDERTDKWICDSCQESLPPHEDCKRG